MKGQLTDSQGQEVLRLADLARWIAHRVWQQSFLPARYLEDLCSDSVVFLCDIILRYSPKTDRWTLKDVASYQLWRLLWGRAARYKRVILMPNDQIFLLAPVLDDSKTDVVLEAVQSLSTPQREVIERRFGLDGNGERSQGQVSRELNVVQSSVCKAESRAIRNLQQWLEEQGCDS